MRFKSSRRCKRTQTNTLRYGRWLLPSHASTITDTEMPLQIEQAAAGGWVGGCGGGITRTSCLRNVLTSVKESFGLFEMSDFEWWMKKSMHATQQQRRQHANKGTWRSGTTITTTHANTNTPYPNPAPLLRLLLLLLLMLLQ